VRHGEDPLPDGHPGQDRLDEIRRLLRHAPPAATGAHRAALARQRDEALERTGVAPNAQKAVREDATAEEGAELPFDEVGSPTPAAGAAAAARKVSRCSRTTPCRTVSAAARVGRKEPRPAAQRVPCLGSNAAAGRANDIQPGEFKTSGRNTRRTRALRRSLTPTRRGGGVDRSAASGRSSPSPPSPHREMRSLTPRASRPVVPWRRPREPLERRASPREAWFYGLARLRKVSARDPESCASASSATFARGRVIAATHHTPPAICSPVRENE